MATLISKKVEICDHCGHFVHKRYPKKVVKVNFDGVKRRCVLCENCTNRLWTMYEDFANKGIVRYNEELHNIDFLRKKQEGKND